MGSGPSWGSLSLTETSLVCAPAPRSQDAAADVQLLKCRSVASFLLTGAASSLKC